MPKKKQGKFYITTPIYYASGLPHIGHAYTTVIADILARYHRLIGDNTFFLVGTDEHGVKIAQEAEKKGLAPREFVDQISAKFQMAWDEFDISHNRFIRTTEEGHIKAVQKALNHMYEKGDIYKGEYKGLYCQGCEQFKNEKDLVNGLCPDHKTKPEKIVEENYLFKMSKYEKKLRKMIEDDELMILPQERKNEILSFYKNEGLADISFSRKNVKWGIPLPWDESHTAYVWTDAFLNYLTGLGWQGTAKKAPEFWPADTQLLAKDIMRVHATIWPAMLLSLDLPLPKKLFVHGYFLSAGQKMSKSLGNVIDPLDLIKKYDTDAARYLLATATPFGNDGDITWDKFDAKFNADLANDLGNLVYRVLTMTEKYFAGVVPEYEVDPSRELGFDLRGDWHRYQTFMDESLPDAAIAIASENIRQANAYIEKQKPWELAAANDTDTLADVIYNLLEILRHTAWMIAPVMPETADKLLAQLGFDPAKERSKSFAELTKWPVIEKGQKIAKGQPLFPKLDIKK